MLELQPPSAVRADGWQGTGGITPPEGAEGVPRHGRRGWFPTGSDALLLIAVIAFGITLLALLPQAFNDDSWLALVAGRDIWASGIPHHETLTAMSQGAYWADQQWLAQLASYAIYRVGGLGLLGLVNVALMTTAVGAAVVAARHRGARTWIVMVILVLCVTQIVPAREVRTQAFAMPLIVATVLLLSADSRRHSRSVYWCLPILILWANLHGTAVLGAAMVSLRGVLFGWERVRRGRKALRWRRWVGPAVLVIGAPICILVTPYGLRMVSYYQATLLNSSFKQLVTEWQPITSQTPIAIPFFILAGLMIWSFGRQPRATTRWEKLVLLALALSSIMVIRNGLVFGLAALAIVPVSLEAAIPHRPHRPAPVRHRLNATLIGTTAALLGVLVVFTLARPARDYEFHAQRPQMLTVVAAQMRANASLKVFADVRYADWLIWSDPQLSGRVAYDARFELLSRSQIVGVVRALSAIGPTWKRAANGYRLLVLSRAASPDAISAFLREPGHRVLYDDGEQVVILRGAAVS